MSILNMQRLEPTIDQSVVAVISCTSSGSDCCKSPVKKPTG
ncbi:class III lanthipeptide [Streptomyces sp. NBC_00433]